ncbi:MAG TPA: glutamate mutase L, partial [Anaerolineae bacterium]|nr:glutamate mutase L [Anaerolineae bacterium]
EIEQVYLQRKMERLPGLSTLSSWSPVPVLPTAKAFGYTIQYLARLDGINVLGVDVGGGSATLAAVVDDQLDLTIRSDLGLSYNAFRLLDQVAVESISRWLPFDIDPTELRNILHNKSLRFRTVAQTREDLLLEQAMVREILRLTLNDTMPHWPKGTSRLYPDLLPKFHLIVGAGGALANAPTYGQAALMLLDALQPVGVIGMVLDKFRLMAPLTAAAMVNPLAAAQVMERDALLHLGTVVAPVGTAREGDTALTFKIEYEDGRSLEVEVAYGSLEVIPLPTGQTANLELRPTRRFDVGLGTKGQAGTTKVEGGVIGIIIDARGRPLPTVEDPQEQQARIQRWLWDMGS